MEAFYTIQGEGRFQGKAAYFIRLAGCDVGCVWCDVKESWDAQKHPQKTIEQIIAQMMTEIPTPIDPLAAPIVVITGGEPLMHDLDRLTIALKALGLRTHIETSGSHPISGKIDWICLSPKKFKAPLPSILPLADELKVVVFNRSDLDWAESFASKVSADCICYLQPEWGKREEVLPLIIDYVKQHPQWQLSIQAHKYINVP